MGVSHQKNGLWDSRGGMNWNQVEIQTNRQDA